jgi:hypothetical protein
MKRNRFDTYRGYRKDKIIPPVILAFCRSLLWRNGKRDRFKNEKLWVRLPPGVSKYVSTNQREHIFRANFRSPTGRGRCFKPSSVQVRFLSEVPLISLPLTSQYRNVIQWPEALVWDQGVAGSNPVIPTLPP